MNKKGDRVKMFNVEENSKLLEELLTKLSKMGESL